MLDRRSQISADIKWFLFDDEEAHENVKNEFGFQHELKFVAWVGDGESFTVTDGKGEYRVRVTKEE